ncbi:Uncharacterised protein [Candidatus Gugararchaeum adminiculabundum]|nr:Uncharacterised protein [Candidatus Gugararchaeum adminiculabundum]
MSEIRLELNGMSCSSCEKLIQRVAEQNGAIAKEVDAKNGFAVFEIDESKVDSLKTQLAEKGFREKGSGPECECERGGTEVVGKYVSDIISGKPEVEVEARLVNYALNSFLALLIIGAGWYFFAMKGLNGNIFTGYAPLILLAIAGSVMTVFSYYHMGCYRKGMSCANGMMVGMTLGMIPGYLAGSLLGITNGMFVGSVVGMAVGIGLGTELGRSCGIMGAMEGMMAGLMAGIMGAMTSIMMFNDHLVPFLYILFAVCGALLAGLSYMMFREAGAAEKARFKIGLAEFFLASLVLSIFLVGMMLYGPKGPVFYP